MPFTLDSIHDLEGVMARRTAAAEAAAAAFPSIRGIAYGPGPAETFDLYPAANAAAPAPVLIFIHGGFWRSMRAAQFAFLAPGFVPFGVALAVIDYPLIPDVRMTGIVAACRRAVGFIHRHAAEHGLDAQRIFVAGNSAGGHLVAEVMDPSWMAADDLPVDGVKGGTAISGLYDLDPVARSFQNDSLQLTSEEVSRFSPLCRPSAITAPMIVAVGGDETGEFLRQSAEYARHVAAGGAAVTHLEVAGTNHITVVLDAFANPQTPFNQATRRQIAGTHARPGSELVKKSNL